MFRTLTGALVGPAGFSLLIAASGASTVGFLALAGMTLVSGLVMLRP